MANILFIAYDYPSILSPESIQVQRRALTLSNNGHKIFVLTSHINPKFEFIDNSLIEKHKNIKIINTKKPIFEALQNFIFKLIDLTDRKYWWKELAIKEAIKIVKNYDIDILYTHSTPLIDHIVGLNVKKEFPKINWVAHFSDPWTLNPYKKYKFKWQYSLNRKLEQDIFKTSNIVTVTSEKTKELFENEFEFLQNRIKVLPHTFDKRLYKDYKKIDDKKIVVHTGNIYGLRTIKYFLEALSKIDIKNIEFHFYGKIKDSEIELMKEHSLENIVKLYPQISYLKSLEVISEADFLLVVDAPIEISPFFPSKLADYIGANKPIIALSPKNSATFDILRDIKNDNLRASSDCIEEIKEILLMLNNEKREYVNMDYYSMENYILLKEIFEK